jgi:hypothetical protein
MKKEEPVKHEAPLKSAVPARPIHLITNSLLFTADPHIERCSVYIFQNDLHFLLCYFIVFDVQLLQI